MNQDIDISVGHKEEKDNLAVMLNVSSGKD